MGVRPPADDDLSEPDVIEFGIPALDARLDDISFPVTADELRATHGDVEIPFNAAGNSISLDEVLNAVGAERFETEQELLNAAHPVFERLRARNPSGLLGRIRNLMPF